MKKPTFVKQTSTHECANIKIKSILLWRTFQTVGGYFELSKNRTMVNGHLKTLSRNVIKICF